MYDRIYVRPRIYLMNLWLRFKDELISQKWAANSKLVTCVLSCKGRVLSSSSAVVCKSSVVLVQCVQGTLVQTWVFFSLSATHLLRSCSRVSFTGSMVVLTSVKNSGALASDSSEHVWSHLRWSQATKSWGAFQCWVWNGAKPWVGWLPFEATLTLQLTCAS